MLFRQKKKNHFISFSLYNLFISCPYFLPLVPPKPIPKPCSKALDQVGHQGRKLLPNQELSHSADSSEHIASKPKAHSSIKSSDSEGSSASEDDTLTVSSGKRPDMTENSHSSTETTSDNPPTENRKSDPWNSSKGNA